MYRYMYDKLSKPFGGVVKVEKKTLVLFLGGTLRLYLQGFESNYIQTDASVFQGSKYLRIGSIRVDGRGGCSNDVSELTIYTPEN